MPSIASMALMDALKDMVDEERRDPHQSSILPEAQVMELRSFLEDYGNVGRFSVGDLVTPKKSSSIRGACQPHIILTIDRDARPDFASGDIGSSGFGQVHDLRVAYMFEGRVIAFWCESYQFEPYVA